MTMGIRVAALFAAYGTIGFSGDYVAGLLAQQRSGDDVAIVVRTVVEPEVDVAVDVRSEVRVDVQVHESSSCSYSVERSQTVALGGAERLSIDAGPGSLVVEGRSDVDGIMVQSRACASEESWLDELRVTVRDDDDVVDLRTEYPQDRHRNGRNNTASIDLTVYVPLGLAVSIDDSSGEMDVSGTGDLIIDDSSGSIHVRGIQGSLSIDDSSGEIEIDDAAGDVVVDDGSGGLEIRDVRGSVTLRDGSGEIDVDGVEHDVRIDSDSSGGIDVRRIGGDFVVGRDGSGGIRHSEVGGRVDVPQKKRRRRGGR